MKQKNSFSHKPYRLILMTVLSLMVQFSVWAQTTETFESATVGNSDFNSNSTAFTLLPNGLFKVNSLNGYGYLSSNKYIDNATSNSNPCQIKSTTVFCVKSLYLYPSTYTAGNYNQTSGVSVSFTGKLAGVIQFTYSPPSADFAAASYSNSTNRGFSLVNFATPGYSDIKIDELVITLAGTTVYFAIDNFTWAIPPATGLDNITANALSLYPNPATNGFTFDAGEKTTNVSIYDLSGSLVLTQQAIGKSYIDITSLQKGVYVVKANGLQAKLAKK